MLHKEAKGEGREKEYGDFYYTWNPCKVLTHALVRRDNCKKVVLSTSSVISITIAEVYRTRSFI